MPPLLHFVFRRHHAGETGSHIEDSHKCPVSLPPWQPGLPLHFSHLPPLACLYCCLSMLARWGWGGTKSSSTSSGTFSSTLHTILVRGIKLNQAFGCCSLSLFFFPVTFTPGCRSCRILSHCLRDIMSYRSRGHLKSSLSEPELPGPMPPITQRNGSSLCVS